MGGGGGGGVVYAFQKTLNISKIDIQITKIPLQFFLTNFVWTSPKYGKANLTYPNIKCGCSSTKISDEV